LAEVYKNEPLNFRVFRYLIKGIIMFSKVIILDLKMGDLYPLENLLFESMTLQNSAVDATLLNLGYLILLKYSRVSAVEELNV